MKKQNYIAILGPTASGKSSLAMKLAEEHNGEIISCDSVQLYKYFDIGSAKPSKEEQERIPHHLIDVLDAHENFDAARYGDLARKAIEEINSRGKLPILVGGTGLYYRFLLGDDVHSLPKDACLKKGLQELTSEELFKKLQNVDSERAKKIHLNDRYRLIRALEIAEASPSNFSDETKQKLQGAFHPKFSILLDPLRKTLHERIEKRAGLMLKEGFINEVKALRKTISKEAKPMTTIGYKEVCAFLDGELDSEEELLFRIICATRQYAKRQVTLFKKFSFDLKVESSTDIDGSLFQ